MPTTSTFMGLQIPTVGGDSNAWGTYLNTDLIAIDLLAVYGIPAGVSTSGALTPGNGPQLVRATGVGGGITLTLPDATVASNKGRTFIIVKVDGAAGAVLVNTTGGQTISGAASFSIASQWSRLGVTCDGANWVAVQPVELLNPGTVTTFSAGALPPIFTTSVSTATTTPALSFTLTNAGAHNFLGNNTGISAAPTYVQPSFSDLAGSIAMAQTPLTTLGDILFVNVTPALARLTGNTTSTKEYLSQTGTGVLSAAPAWSQISVSDLAESTTGTGTIVRSVSPTLTGTVGLPIVTLTGKITNYNSLATAGQGVAPILVVNATTPPTPVGSSNVLASAPIGIYKVTYYSVVTTTGVITGSPPSGNTFSLNFIYTDVHGSQTQAAFTNSTFTAGDVNQGSFVIQNNAINNINYSITEAGSFATHPVLAVWLLLERLN